MNAPVGEFLYGFDKVGGRLEVKKVCGAKRQAVVAFGIARVDGDDACAAGFGILDYGYMLVTKDAT